MKDSFQYEEISEFEKPGITRFSIRRFFRLKKYLRIVLIVLTIFSMVSISKILSSGLIFASQDQFRDVNDASLLAKEQYNIVKYLAAAGPYIQNPGNGISTEIPEQCSVEQVQYYSRHGERFPGISAGKKHQKLVDRLQNYSKSINGPLSFLNEYTYYANDDLYEYETTPSNSPGPYTGYETLAKAGSSFRARYNDLYEKQKDDKLPIFIAASKRVYDSAIFFTQGFLGEEFSDDKYEKVVVSEEKSQGVNSLTPRWACPEFNSSSNKEYVSQFPSTYLDDIVDRVTKDNDGLEVSTDDVKNFFELCAYELNSKGYSPFCDLFTQNEFVNYAYANDLNFYYSSGPGGNYTKEIGSVQLNASLALLKDDDSNNKIWLTFSHDTDIEIFHAALGLFDPINPLPNDRVEFRDTYRHTDIVPMGGRTITEKLKCGDDTFVRFVINDAVVTVPGCSNGPGFSCKLQDFENYIEKKIGSIDFHQNCKVPDDIPQFLTFYWDYSSGQYNAEAPRTTA